MSSMSVPFMRLEHAEGLPAPSYASEGAAGLDLMAALPETEPVVIAPKSWAAIPTGLVFEIPRGFQGEVRPRSGLALRHAVTVLNAPGTIDSDYRGEVRVVLVNLGPEAFTVTRGMRVAQLLFVPVARMMPTPVRSLSTTARGDGGFGSTGLANKVLSE
ncbi:MAG TPA: dUTP diphosphatase [Xanthobacteraceae bacterium]|nr:dUTP diphosphatase [Xanthobacteraceae bacterium]